MTVPSRAFDEHSIVEELKALSTEYGAAADDRDGDRFAGLFVAGGELVVPNYPTDLRPVISRVGHDELCQIPGRLRIYARTFHQVSNHRYVLDGAEATGTVLCVAHHAAAAAGGPDGGGEGEAPDGIDSGTDTVWFIRYDDSYRSTETGWKFSRRELHLQWVEVHPIAPPGVLPPPDSPTG